MVYTVYNNVQHGGTIYNIKYVHCRIIMYNVLDINDTVHCIMPLYNVYCTMFNV